MSRHEIDPADVGALYALPPGLAVRSAPFRPLAT